MRSSTLGLRSIVQDVVSDVQIMISCTEPSERNASQMSPESAHAEITRAVERSLKHLEKLKKLLKARKEI